MKASQSLLSLLFALVVSSAMAQDIHFSQFYSSPLNLNPALTGVMNCNQRVVANSWLGLYLQGDAGAHQVDLPRAVARADANPAVTPR